MGVNEKRGEKEIEIPTIERGSETERGREEKEGGRERDKKEKFLYWINNNGEEKYS